MNGTCGCQPNTYYNKATNKCDAALNCTTGFYHNGVINTCLPCGTNCTSCAKTTGNCLTCASNNIINTADPKSCLFECKYKVGPVGNHTLCLEKAHNTTQVIPPFPDNTSFDWRSYPIIWGVQDSGSCGSSWAFSAIASLESAYAIKTGALYALSE